MKIRLIYIILIFFSFNTWAQDTLNFKTVDATSYQAYINKDWKTVIRIGNQALKQKIDYYYLRMRLGIAYFEKKNYRKSIVHFEKAMSMNNQEVVATEYLYYAYKNIGDDIQAVKTLEKSDTKFANKLFLKQTIFQNIYAFYSTRIYENSKLKDASLPAYQSEVEIQKKPIYVEQYIPESYSNYQLGTTVRLSPSWRLDGSFQYFSTQKEQYILDPINETSKTSNVSQNQWHINNTFRLSNRLKASVFFSYLSQKYNYISIKSNQVPVSYEEIQNGKSSNLLLGLGLSTQQNYYDLEWSASFFSNTTAPILQSNLSLKIFPFGNRALFTESGISLLKADSTAPKPIFSQSITYSPHERISLSLTGNWGEMQNWNTNNAYVIYNGIYNLTEIYQTQITARIYKGLYAKLYYQYLSNTSDIFSKSLFPSNSEDTPQVIDNTKFNTHSIIGGLIWEF